MHAPAAADDGFALIQALRNPACFAHPVSRMALIETHISWVILTGAWVYKIKKPVHLPFLDFTTLEARRRYCEEEVRLNRRFAPSVYDGVVAITGSVEHPCVGGNAGAAIAIEYAVRMREFPQDALASRLLAAGALRAAHIDALAARVAAFHAAAGVAAHGSPYGTPDAVIAPARENFSQLEQLLTHPCDRPRIAELRAWTEREYQAHWAQFQARHAQGHVRECHGDLHLGNIVMLDDALTPFDCIEFDPGLRWIDVMNEAAFAVMDLQHQGRRDFAARFLNAYLEAGGDYAGLAVLRFYQVYRAVVRAKVEAVRAAQAGITAAEHAATAAACRGYLELALHQAHDHRPALILMHGLSGSGKSVLAQFLADQLGAIRVRSDIERKRISGLVPLARSRSAPARGIYTTNVTSATYHRLIDLARAGASAGYTVIVDAACLKRWQRDLFRREAAARNMLCVLVDVTAPQAVLRARIAARLAAGSDASEADPAVLDHQLLQQDPLSADELTSALCVDTAQTDEQSTRDHTLQALRARLPVEARSAFAQRAKN